MKKRVSTDIPPPNSSRDKYGFSDLEVYDAEKENYLEFDASIYDKVRQSVWHYKTKHGREYAVRKMKTVGKKQKFRVYRES